MMHLGWFLTEGFGVYGWRQQWSGNSERDIGRPDLFVDTARSLERAGFDYLMLEDSSVLPGVFRGTYERSVRTGTAIRFDPMPLVPLLAAATEHIGIIATAATSFYPPFLAARLMTTLDHLTNGRVGINLVTASADGAAQNYGFRRRSGTGAAAPRSDPRRLRPRHLPGEPAGILSHRRAPLADFGDITPAGAGPVTAYAPDSSHAGPAAA